MAAPGLDWVVAWLLRTWAMVIKEFIQLRRDRMTFALMMAVPATQLILFGYAINADPRHLPTAVFARDASAPSRAVVAALENSGYYSIDHIVHSGAEIDRLILAGDVVFAIEIPADFGRDMIRGEQPQVLVIADASDPAATGPALAALSTLVHSALVHEHTGLKSPPGGNAPAFEFVVHRRFNPAGETSLNIVPGLIGTILMLSMIIFTALAVTREIERGTMENLLAMPIRPVEIMLGKIIPYILVGALQFALILVASRLLFDVPVEGSLMLLVALTTLFIVANLAIGYTFSTIASNQLQAMQMAVMFYLPNLLLSGFLYPFLGMPAWAQAIGEVLPLTHFMRIVRGIMLKGSGFGDLQSDVAALALFTVVTMAVAVARFRQTLD